VKHSQVPGLGHQVSGSGVLVQAQVQDPHPYLNPITRTWLPTAETRDPKKYPAANYPVPLWCPLCGRCLPCPRANLPACPLAAAPRSPLHFCTRLRRSCTFALPLSDQPSLWASGPL